MPITSVSRLPLGSSGGPLLNLAIILPLFSNVIAACGSGYTGFSWSYISWMFFSYFDLQHGEMAYRAEPVMFSACCFV